jgi:DNA-binding NarL/FixJ family response regulator
MRVAIAEDSGVMREALVEALTRSGARVLAAAADGEALLAAVAGEPPDVAIIDMRMPPTRTDEGLVTARRLWAAHPRTAVLVWSADPAAPYAADVLVAAEAGVGYLLKDNVMDRSVLVDVLNRLAAGQVVVDPEVEAILAANRSRTERLRALSDREREILSLMAEGLSNADIGRRAFLSVKTIETHIAAVFTKLGLGAGSGGNRRVRAVLTWLQAEGRLP